MDRLTLIKQAIQSLSGDLYFILPELVLSFGLLMLVIGEIAWPGKKNNVKWLLTLLIVVSAIAVSFQLGSHSESIYLFANHLWFTSFSNVLRILVLCGLLVVLLYEMDNRSTKKGEYYIALLGASIGCLLTTVANSLISIFVFVELISLSSYILVALNFKKESFEGSIKYLIFGAITTAISLFGASLLFGWSGSIHINEIADFIQFQSSNNNGIGITVIHVMFLGSLFFKLSIFPFHIWTPDTYQSANTSVTAFLSTLPKVAVFGLYHLISNQFNLNGLESWVPFMASLVIATLVLGNFGALKQQNLKRLFSYSSIAHSGFILVAFFNSDQKAILFYLTTYVVMNLTIFHFIHSLEEYGIYRLKDLSKIKQVPVLLMLSIMVVLVSLMGLPPTGGFFAKFFIFSNLWQVYQSNHSFWLLAVFVIGLLSVAVSLYYYLRIPYYLFLKDLKNEDRSNISDPTSISIKFRPSIIVFQTILALTLFWLFVKPDVLLELF